MYAAARKHHRACRKKKIDENAIRCCYRVFYGKVIRELREKTADWKRVGSPLPVKFQKSPGVWREIDQGLVLPATRAPSLPKRPLRVVESDATGTADAQNAPADNATAETGVSNSATAGLKSAKVQGVTNYRASGYHGAWFNGCMCCDCVPQYHCTHKPVERIKKAQAATNVDGELMYIWRCRTLGWSPIRSQSTCGLTHTTCRWWWTLWRWKMR